MPLYLSRPKGKHGSYRIRGTFLEVTVEVSTGLRDRVSAQKELKHLEQQIADKRYSAAKGPTFNDAALTYAKATQNEQQARFLAPLMQEMGSMLLLDITQGDIDKVADKLYPIGKPSSRQRAVYGPVSAVMSRAGVMGVRTPDGGRKRLEGPRVERDSDRRGLKPEEAMRLLATARADWQLMAADETDPNARSKADSAHRFFVLLMWLFYTGCRKGEALRVRALELDLHRGEWFCVKTKNRKGRAVYLPKRLVAELERLPAREDGRMFSDVKHERLHDLAKRAGVHIPAGIAYHITRHSWANWMRQYAGIDTSGLVATGAWDSESAARIYEHLDISAEARKADALPDLLPDGSAAGALALTA